METTRTRLTPEQKIAILRQGYDAFNRGDINAVIDLQAEDAVWHGRGSTKYGGDFKGKERILGLLTQVPQDFEEFKLDVHDVLANDEHAVFLVTSRSRRKGKSYEDKAVHVHPHQRRRKDHRTLVCQRHGTAEGRAAELASPIGRPAGPCAGGLLFVGRTLAGSAAAFRPTVRPVAAADNTGGGRSIAENGADLVVVGAGTIGGWASYFAKTSGADRVVVIEQHRAGDGASSRAAGVVRAQGGTPTTVALGQWSIDFYRRQRDVLGTDSGFRELGYLILALSEADVRAGLGRVAMQQRAGLPVRWLQPHEAVMFNGCLDAQSFRGASYLATDGCIDPPRNVRAYSLAMQAAGVELREHTRFVGLQTTKAAGSTRVTTVNTDHGRIVASRVILTGGPQLREVGQLAGIPIWAGAVRHQVAVTEPHPAFQVERQAMGFDLSGGLYWRLEDGGLLFGMSNPDEVPGAARSIDWPYLERMRQRLAGFLPVTSNLELRKVWAATIDYTADHQPILGPALTANREPIAGVTVASPGGHGMMWGPAVARIAADLALDGKTDLVDVSGLGLDRFDEHGRSRLATDPVALPFPVEAPVTAAAPAVGS